MADDTDSGEKTEEPSQHKMEESRKKGEVASSKEFNSVLILTGTFLVLVFSGVYIFELMGEYIEWLYGLEISKAYSQETLREIFKKTILLGVKSVAPVFLASSSLGILSQLMQIGFIYAPEVLSIKLDRVNPINGFKKLFSKKSIVETLKALFKFGIILGITYMVLKSNVSSFTGFLHVELGEAIGYGKFIALKLAVSILVGLLIIAFLDFAWEKYTYKQKHRLTKQQQKEEGKEREGNPEIKQRIRALQRKMATGQMIKEVSSADVIITNPTHISIAIRYNAETMIAPQVVAKGADNIAMKIRELAKDKEIPLVENIPLARALYATVKVGEGVPKTLYKTVAEILAYVYKVKRKKKAVS